ncbi:cytochrome P450 [Sphingobium sp. 15-1]|uniref:cytochrome P450 n=1 Tax=Sphingobium sp. 15-1 TaxID=2729616 RepID=UPI00159C100C|nr:cytochrome P450 [Sphingobium sp. 15-1]
MSNCDYDLIPPHVAEEAAISLRLFDRVTISECPQETLIPQIHETLGPITWVTNIFMAHQGGWLLTRMEDIQTILRDGENFTKRGMGKFAQSIGEDWLVIPTETDPPAHGQYREALNPYFAPQRMAAMRDNLHERAITLINSFKDRGHCDFVHEFSEKFPIYIVLDLLGLPQERLEEFLQWEKEILHTKTLEARASVIAHRVGRWRAAQATANVPSTSSRIAASADFPLRRAVPVTDRYPAWI